MVHARKRPYDASDLKELMDNCGGWAHSWNDVLRYLKGPAPYDADFAKDEVPALIDDIEAIKKKGVEFTYNYRDVWEAITGQKVKGPPPEGLKTPPTNPIELEDKYLKGLKFPASKNDAQKQAEKNGAPERVLKVLREVADKRYDNINILLEAIGDKTWDHD